MKKFLLGLIFGSVAFYATLFIKPSLVGTIGLSASCDSTACSVDSTKATIAPVAIEVSPAVATDTAKADSIGK